MIKNRDSLKARASNLSKKTNIPNKYLIQNFMFEALLKRISKSKYYGFRYYYKRSATR